MPGALHERLIRLWASPQGAPKAADAGGDKTRSRTTPAGRCDVSGSGCARRSGEGHPEHQNQAERVEVTLGNVVTEFTYATIRTGTTLNKIEAFYAGKLAEKRNGTTLRDLTTVETETGNVYVVMPVPASVRAASK